MNPLKTRIACIGLLLACSLNFGPALAAPAAQDPAEISEGLRAVFKLGDTSDATRARLNANTITVMTGTIGGTYVQFGADLASVLDDGDKLRVLPIIGRGSVQSLADIVYLHGVDLGIMRSDTLDYLERKGYTKNLQKQLAYVTKLYNEEMHVVAPKSIHNLSDLRGKTISVDLPNGGTFITAMTVFERLGIDAKFVFIEQRVAFEKLRNGEIDAMVAVQGKPSKFIAQISDPNLHLVPIDYAPPLQSDYLPSKITAKDYPALIPNDGNVDTIAVPAILAVYNWAPGTDRYRKLQLFVDRFFDHIAAFQRAPFHPKWQEVALTSPLAGWTRFQPAQSWLDKHNASAQTDARRSFDEFLASRQTSPAALETESQRAELFKQFLDWQAAKRRAHPKPAVAHRATPIQSATEPASQ